jgi:uncharacterized cysteine cluster protein YcgN (CxxCxxCC family)|tara:strand:- start:503 stop:808 length:306 start_codon:yes stop_codon:yes gene_type:complete
MTFSRNMPVSIRFDLDLLDIIDKITETDFDGNRTNCVTKLVQDGLKLKKFQQTIQDNPEKSNEIITEMNEKIENESVYDWLNNLTDRQKKGIVEYIQTTTD